MTDRVHSFQVVLDKNMRIDDAEAIKNALLQVKGVIDVQANVADFVSTMAESRAKQELGLKLLAVIRP